MHVDMDAFFASVEQRDHAELRGKPVVVGGSPADRGVVAAASYEARTYGIHSAMPMAQALRLCPRAIRRPPNFSAYREESRIIHALFLSATSIVEPVALDEAYLDLSDQAMDFEHASAIGRRLKEEIKKSTRLTASVGIGPNKFLAKLASGHNKPDGFCVIHPNQIPEFLSPLPVRKIPGVGEKTERRLAALQVHTIEQLREISMPQLQSIFGEKQGERLHQLARGIDATLVVKDRKRKSLSQEQTFSQDVSDLSKMKEFLRYLSSEISALLSNAQLAGYTVGIKVRYDDFRLATRSLTLDHPTRDAREISEIACRLLNRIDPAGRKVRLLGVRVAGFDENQEAEIEPLAESDWQLTFW